MTERKKSHQEEYAEKIAKELIERLKQGTAPFQLPWLPDMGRDFPFNPVSGTEYSGMNRLNLMIQGYSDPRWMTYKQAQSVNAQVRKRPARTNTDTGTPEFLSDPIWPPDDTKRPGTVS